jgi:thiamine biosynthesis protein ThiS
VTITLNGEPREVPEACTVHTLLASLERGDETLAVAVNGRVIPSDRYGRSLAPEDRVDIVTAVGGG